MSPHTSIERAFRLLADASHIERHHDAVRVVVTFFRTTQLGAISLPQLDGRLRGIQGHREATYRGQVAAALLVPKLAAAALHTAGLEPGLPEAILRPGLFPHPDHRPNGGGRYDFSDSSITHLPHGFSNFIPLVARGSCCAMPDPADPAGWREIEWDECRGTYPWTLALPEEHPILRRQAELRGWLVVADVEGLERHSLPGRMRDNEPRVIRALLDGHDDGWRKDLRAQILDETRTLVHGFVGGDAAFVGRALWPPGAEIVLVQGARRLVPPQPTADAQSSVPAAVSQAEPIVW
jgi:hypothetical protein